MRGSVVYAVIEGIDKEKVSDEFSYEILKLPWTRFVFDGRISISDSNSSIYTLQMHQLLQHLEITENINIDQLIQHLNCLVARTLEGIPPDDRAISAAFADCPGVVEH